MAKGKRQQPKPEKRKKDRGQKEEDAGEEEVLPPVCTHALELVSSWVDDIDVETLELKCEQCDADDSAGTGASKQGKGKGKAQQAAGKKGGKAAKGGRRDEPPAQSAAAGAGDLMLCLSCGKLLCEAKHAVEHATKRKPAEQGKKKKTDEQHHQLAVYASSLLERSFRCYCYTHKHAMRSGSAHAADEDEGFEEDEDPGALERTAILHNICDTLCSHVCSSPKLHGGLLELKSRQKGERLASRGSSRGDFSAGLSYSGGKKHRRNGGREAQPPALHAVAVQAGMKGLANMGNTCFFNSVLQVLNQTGALVDFFLSHRDKESVAGEISVAMCVAMVKMREVGKCHYRPDTLFRAVANKAPHFQGWGQQDAQELLRFLLDGMHWEYQSKQKRLRGTPEAANVRNIVSSAFEGTIGSTIICHACTQASRRLEPFYDLSLSLNREQPAHGGVGEGLSNGKLLSEAVIREWVRGNRQFSLSFHLSQFFAPELLHGANGYLCENCCKEAFLAEQRRREEEERQKEERMREIMERATATAASLEAVMAADDNAQSDDDDEEEEDEEEEAEEAEEDEHKEQTQEEGRGPAESAGQAPPPPEDMKASAVLGASVATEITAVTQSVPSETATQSEATGSIRTLTTATKQCAVFKLPQILTLHLKRFAYAGKGWRKDSSPVSFPRELDISAFVHPEARPTVDPIVVQLAEQA